MISTVANSLSWWVMLVAAVLITAHASYYFRIELGDYILALYLRLKRCDYILANEYLARRIAIRWLRSIRSQLVTQKKQARIIMMAAGRRSDGLGSLMEKIEVDLQIFLVTNLQAEEQQHKLWQALMTKQSANTIEYIDSFELHRMIDFGVIVVHRHNQKLADVQKISESNV